jgi:hypothetical protein
MAEGYFQHAEHYFRVLNAINQAAQQNQQQNQHGQRRPFQNGEDGAQPASGNEEAEAAPPGTGDQPESKEIPIAAAPPEA